MGDFFKNLIIPRYQNNYFPRLLRKRFLTVVTIGILSFNIATGGGQLGAFAGEISSTRLIELTNQERAAAGLSQLRADSRLTTAATAKANNMLQLQYWAHYGPNGETPWQFILAAGYNYVYAGENLAKGFSSSEAVHSAWMASQTHRENIMKSNYQDIGIAVVQGNLQDTEVVLVVQMFGALSQTPPAAPPQPAAPPSIPDENGGNNQPTVQQPEPTPAEEPFVSVTYPTNGSRMAESEFNLVGETNVGETTVVVEDGESEGEGTVGEDGIWDYRPENGWTDGAHDVTVWNQGRSVSSSVSFGVDTTAPVIDDKSLSVESIADKGMLTLSVNVDETAQDVLFVGGGYSVSLERKEAGVFVLSVNEADIGDADSMKLIATDDLGNTSEVDITQDIKGVLSVRSNADSPSFLSGIGNLGSADISRLVTRGVVVVIALLLIIDAVYLYRLNIIHTRGKTLFPMAVWIILMGIGLAVGRGGNIL